MTQHSFKVDTRLAFLLSENYRSPEKALKELIDNAWDAEATKVCVTLPELLSDDPIIVQDNGSGMTINELQSEYLNIARNRRDRNGDFSPNLRRRVKGRKGIGKFAGLMITSSMRLETWARNKYSAFSFDKSLLERYEGLPDMPLEIEESDSTTHSGTCITLSHLNQSLRYPTAQKLKQILLAEYGRESNFDIFVNGKELGVDDLQGEYKEEKILLGKSKATLRCTVTDQKRKLRKPGISVRINGKVIGDPIFFGLDKSDDIPKKLLEKLYGEVDLEGNDDDITADWGALIEGSQTEKELTEALQPLLQAQLKSVYGQEMHLAQARLRKKALERISKLPENRRDFADKAIKKVLDRFYQEPESKLEPVVNVLLDALEHSDYRAVIEHINAARNSEVSRFAEALEEFGFVEMASVAEQAAHRLSFLDYLEEICLRSETLESHVHKAIEGNLWMFGVEHSLFSSNTTLKRQVEEYLGKKYIGDRADRRPDLFLTQNQRV
ncbi:ATP-binding protein [Pseudoalteromonas rubra]|uniref:ATP-binding protein n=1 Tax=Pseudoalteromonas rubra TaxID=43658 RepID=UPI0009E29621|nr:ATP-binding protein [Pseudoalteromonas rubra]